MKAEQAREIHEICSREGYVLPTFHQGGFNPLQPCAAAGLFPTLRESGKVFHAYSPLAEGLLAKPTDEVVNATEGTRFTDMPNFGQIHLAEKDLEELRELTRLSKRNNR